LINPRSELHACDSNNLPLDSSDGESLLGSLASAAYSRIPPNFPRPFHAVGHSLGAAILASMSVDHPKDIRSVSLICPAFRGQQEHRLLVARRAWAFSWQFLQVAQASSAYHVSRDFVRNVVLQPQKATRLSCVPLHEVDAKLYSLVSIPKLVISAEFDDIYPASESTKIGGARNSLVPGGHEWVITNAEDAASIVREFIASVEARTLH
jgi:pimeloyl-ACP methyl ester carboxylesterase